MNGSLVTKIRCPSCGGWMPPPFAVIPAPVANTHIQPSDPHGPRCRVVVIAHPSGRHEITPVREGQTFEGVMTAMLSRWS